MKTHLYRIQQLRGAHSVGDLVNFVGAEPSLRERNRTIDGFINRIERVESIDNDGARCLMVNHVKIRMDHGPGRAGQDQETAGFDMGHDEGFSEETSALFDLDHGHAVIEYNHHGSRFGAIAEYLALIHPNANNAFELLPCLDDEAMQRFQNLRIITKAEIRVAPGRITPQDKHRMGSFIGSLDYAQQAGAEILHMTLGGIRGRPSALGNEVRSVLGILSSIVGREPAENQDDLNAVTTLKVSGKQHQEMAAETIDLVKGRVYGEHSLTPGPDKRFSVEDRWNALRRDHISWRSAIRGI